MEERWRREVGEMEEGGERLEPSVHRGGRVAHDNLLPLASDAKRE